ncbi:MAG: hypothetical protein ACYC1D_05665, partial [Acidimicrobiales bacterium]
GASYNPSTLQGLSMAQIAQQAADPATAVARGIDATAGVISARLCQLTGGRPGAVCSAFTRSPTG